MARRRRSGLISLVVVVVIGALLATGVYIADGYVRDRVQDRVAAKLQQTLATPGLPTVQITGSPFLTQVATRDVRHVHVVADQIGGTSENALPVAHADLEISDVTTTDWFESMTAGHIEGTALVAYDVLQSLAKSPIEYGGDGRLKLSVTTAVLDVDVHAVITGTPRLEQASQSITLADPKISVAGVDLPDFTAQALLRAVLKPIPITGLPTGILVSSVSADTDGLHAEVTGDDVPLQ